MARFFGTPKVQYFDNNGNPLANGKLYSYDVGTTNARATYPTIADSDAETNANANPVILDSRGEANVVLKGPTRLILQDSDSNEIWDIDNISESTSFSDANGNTVLDIGAATSAVNYFDITNNVSGSSPIIGVDGTDSNIDINWTSKGTGEVYITESSLKLEDAEGFKDDSGNFYLRLQKTASAVNYLDFGNAATGSNPLIEAKGGDENVGITFKAKGTGVYNLLSTSDQASYMRLYEDTDNGSNYIELQAPASITSNRTYTISDASGTLSTVPTTQSSLESETDESTYIKPSQPKYSPGVVKAWARFDSSATPSVAASYNIDSVSKSGTGVFVINFDTDMSSANYTVIASGQHASVYVVGSVTSKSTSSVTVSMLYNNGVIDPVYSNVIILGDF